MINICYLIKEYSIETDCTFFENTKYNLLSDAYEVIYIMSKIGATV